MGVKRSEVLLDSCAASVSVSESLRFLSSIALGFRLLRAATSVKRGLLKLWPLLFVVPAIWFSPDFQLQRGFQPSVAC